MCVLEGVIVDFVMKFTLILSRQKPKEQIKYSSYCRPLFRLDDYCLSRRSITESILSLNKKRVPC